MRPHLIVVAAVLLVAVPGESKRRDAKKPIVVTHQRRRHLDRLAALRGGADHRSNKDDTASSLVAATNNPPAFVQNLRLRVDVPKVTDALLAGAGLAGTMALMGALEPKLGLKLFVPPMMASGIIFFSPATPPSPKGVLSGTVGCASVSQG